MTEPQQNQPAGGHPALVSAIRAEMGSAGRIPFARFMELALYHPEHGYYMAATRRPGRGGDFLTAPELHPFFGLTLARQVRECWERLGRPAPFTVLEYGAGIGGLAYDVIAGLLNAEPGLRSSLRYRLNETNPHRVRQALDAMAAVGLDDIVVADDPPDAPITGVILANEVADAMPVHRLQWTGEALEEIWVGWDDDFGFVDRPGPLSPAVAALDPSAFLASAGVNPRAWPVGARIEISPAARQWVRDLAGRLDRGYALIVDYGYAASELYAAHRLEGTLRAYSEHTVTDEPYAAAGERDLTAHVDFTSLAREAEVAGMTDAGLATQADFLAAAGLGELLVHLQQEPGLSVEEYYRAQAAVFRLIDPAGMGRFRVLGLARDAPIAPPLRGFAGPALPASLQLD